MSGTENGGGARILVVDDEPVVQDVLRRLLSRAGHDLSMAASGTEAREIIASGSHDLVFLDVMLPDDDGLELLRHIKQNDPERPVIMMTAHGTVDNAVEAMKEGAIDYLTKPFSNDEVLVLVQKALETHRLQQENRMLRSMLAGEGSFEGIIGSSEPIQSVFRMVEQVAPSRSTVLILGESGTGKELVARAVHRRSTRNKAPFVPVHSGGIPTDLMESNLFGSMKGAFTGAVADREGLFQAANGGTIFFDEIGTLRPELQSKLLRVMQERSFMPVGSTKSVSVDVRVLAATNVDLKDLMARGDFREDLYYRLDVLRVRLPPLRERREDIPLLVNHFVRKYALENDKRVDGVEAEALEALLRHDWPGNVRELENAVVQGVVLAPGRELRLADLPPDLRTPAPAGPPAATMAAGATLAEAMQLYERRMIEAALLQAGGVQRQAARALGIRPTTLNEKLKRLGLRPESPADPS